MEDNYELGIFFISVLLTIKTRSEIIRHKKPAQANNNDTIEPESSRPGYLRNGIAVALQKNASVLIILTKNQFIAVER